MKRTKAVGRVSVELVVVIVLIGAVLSTALLLKTNFNFFNETTYTTTLTSTLTTVSTLKTVSTSTLPPVTSTTTSVVTSVETNYFYTTPSSLSGSPFLRSSTWAFSNSGTTASCILTNVTRGDELFAIVQSSGSPQTSMTANDSASDSFSYGQDWSYDIGMGGAYTQTTASGSVQMTITVNNGLASLSMFCYDIGGVTNTVAISKGYTTYPSSNSSASVPAFSTQPHSLLIDMWAASNAPGGEPTFFSASGWQLAPGSPLAGQDQNYIVSEWSNDSGSETTATCPISLSSSEHLGGICFAFP